MDFFSALTAVYIGAAGSLLLPQGGGDMDRLGGGLFRAGVYVNDFWAFEAEAGLMERKAQLGVQCVWHWWGYERLDPFFTFGAKGWIDDGDAGPCGGIGAFYHLDEHWSLRADAGATLGIERESEMIYQFAFGVQYEF